MPAASNIKSGSRPLHVWTKKMAACLALIVAVGFWGKEAHGQLSQEQVAFNEAIVSSTYEEITDDPALYEFARAKGAAAFAKNCSRCHGSEGQGTPGIPALIDNDWVWGGDFESIYWTIRYGVRGKDMLTRASSMPEFTASGDLSGEEAGALAEFVLTLSQTPDFESPAGKNFVSQCAACHGPYGEGYKGYGAPALNDRVWLYGETIDDIRSQIMHAQHGMMPAWDEQLPPEVVKSLAVYVHSLGGGE